MTSITMDKKETLIFNKVEVEGFSSKEQVVEKMRRKMYNDKNGLGFTNITVEDNIVFATILLRTPSYIRSYNEKEGVFVQQVVNIYGDFEIAVDIEHGLIFSTSSSTFLFNISLNSIISHLFLFYLLLLLLFISLNFLSKS